MQILSLFQRVAHALTRIYSGPSPAQVLHQPVLSVPVRALDVIYQNTGGRPKLVIATIICVRAAVVNAQALAVAQVGATTPPNTILHTVGLDIASNNYEAGTFGLTFAVPRNYYYRIASYPAGVGSGVGLDTWSEVDL